MIIKNVLITMFFSTMLFSFDMAGISASVDYDKAMSSINSEKAMAAASKGTDITMEDVTNSIDTDKAVESVDKEKLLKLSSRL